MNVHGSRRIDWFTTLRDDFPRSDEIPPLLAHAEGRLREQKKSEHIKRESPQRLVP